MSNNSNNIPKGFSEADFNYEQKKAETPIYFVYPKYVEALKKHRIPISKDMADTNLTDFIQRVSDQNDFEKKIPTVMRLKSINKEEPNKGKKVEYMIWYENWEGTDKNGNPIPSVADLPKGIDKSVTFSKRVDGDGNETYTKQKESWLYTEPWNPERLDEILQETNTDAEDVHYILKGFRSWSGFDYNEFRNLSFEELQERGRTGKVQQPVVTSTNTEKTQKNQKSSGKK